MKENENKRKREMSNQKISSQQTSNLGEKRKSNTISRTGVSESEKANKKVKVVPSPNTNSGESSQNTSEKEPRKKKITKKGEKNKKTSQTQQV